MLTTSFFNASTVQIARKLLGVYLVHDGPEGSTAGRIVETEAYLSKGDPACHAARGQTRRNAPMFGQPGSAYVYLIYGMYHCFNVVTAKPGRGEAVLIRAIEPVSGIDLMRERRGQDKLMNLCSGPGKLVIAMGIGMEHNSQMLLGAQNLFLTRKLDGLPSGIRKRSEAIYQTTRIGIKEGSELQLRFYIEGSPFVSRN